MEKKSPWNQVKAVFLKGLAALLPTALTIYIIIFLFGFVKESISRPVTTFIWMQCAKWSKRVEERLISNYKVDPKYFEKDSDGSLKYEKELYEDITRKVPWWPGFLLVLMGIFSLGIFLASFFGRKIWRIGESVLTKLPLVREVYSSAKQVTDFVFASERKGKSYSKVVAIEFPKEGMWCVGFQTGWGLEPLKRNRQSYVSVFVPCSPTPMSGFTVVVPEEKIIRLDMTFDEAMQFVISCGMVVPQKLMTEEGKKAVLLESSSEVPILEGEKPSSDKEKN